MQCERLLKLTKNWYLRVKDETMAPARMIQFIKDHVATCDLCLADPDIQDEIEKITVIVLPESKIPKAVRLQQEKENNIREEAEMEAEKEKAREGGEDQESEEGGESGEGGEEQEKYIDDDDEDEDLEESLEDTTNP